MSATCTFVKLETVPRHNFCIVLNAQPGTLWAGEWDPEAYRSRAGMSMSGTDEDWSEMGIDERQLQMVGFSGRVRANAASAQLAQERQTSYMYIMPQEHSSYRESQEVRPCLGMCMHDLGG